MILVDSVVPNIEEDVTVATAGSDSSSSEDEGSDSELVEPGDLDYDSDQIGCFLAERRQEVTETLVEYKEINKGMSFRNIVEARKFMRLNALVNKKELKLVKSDKVRLRYKCEEGCPFVCLISSDKGQIGCRVKTLNSKHTCADKFDNRSISYATIAHYFKRKLQDDPKYKVKEMRADLNRVFHLNATLGKCKLAKKMILEKLEGSFTDDYNKLEGYAKALRDSNPGTDVVLNLSKEALLVGKRKFLRMYICFQTLKMGFKDGLRNFIGLDGTFLKGKAKGQLLVAVGQDNMKHFFPIAWVVVDKETKRSWTWFLELLKNSLELNMGEGVTFMSDIQKGLLDAIMNVFPEAKRRYCARHVEANWSKNHRSLEMKKLFWWASWSTYEEDFKDQLKVMGQFSESCVKCLLKYPPQYWCRTYFDTVCKNPSVTNNLTESFNSWILEARYKPIIKMLETIRVKVMNLLHKREELVLTWNKDFSPTCLALYNDFLKIAQHYEVVANGDDGYEVNEGEDKHIVKLTMKRCTCRVWDIFGIPCPHAISALKYLKRDPETEIHSCYSKGAYLLTYWNKIQPVPGEKFWTVEPTDAMEPPEMVNLAGRPKVKRVREKDESSKREGEWSMTRKERLMSCGYCGEIEHNSRGYKKPVKAKPPKPGKGKKIIEPGQTSKAKHQQIKRKRSLIDEASDEEIQQTQEDIHSSAPQPTQLTQEDQYMDAAPKPVLQPLTISEVDTRIRPREMLRRCSGSRTISFRGDETGVSEPTSLPYSPTKLTWKGKAAVTSNQLEKEVVETILQKLKPRKKK